MPAVGMNGLHDARPKFTNWFNEGFGHSDLKDAKALLD